MKPDKYINSSFFIRQGNALHRVDYTDIAFAESDGNYVFIHTAQQRRYALKMSLKKLNEQLPYFFCRSHKGYIINMQMCRVAEEPDTLEVLSRKIPIGRAYKRDVMAHLAGDGDTPESR